MKPKMWKWFLFFSVCVFGLYLKTVSYPFINFDDWWIVHNPALGHHLLDFSKEARMNHGAEFLPIRDISAFLQYSTFGDNPVPYRLVQLTLYLGATFVFCTVLLNLGFALETALLSTALFLFHPLHVEPVVWLSSHKDILSFFFISLSFYAYLKDKRRISTLMFLLAVFSKYYVVGCVVLFPIMDTVRSKKWEMKKYLPFLMVAALGTALSFYVAQVVDYGHAENKSPILFSFPGLVFLAVQKWLWPYPLHLLYVYGNTLPDLLSSESLQGLLFIILCATIAWNLRKSSPKVAFMIAFVFLTLLPTLKAPAMHFGADRYFLLPSLGLGVLLCHFLQTSIGKTARIATIGMIGAVFAWLSYQQMDVWANNLRLWEHAASFGNIHPVTMKNLAKVYQEEKNWNASLRYYRMLTSVADPRDNEYALFWLNHGYVALQKKLLPEAQQAFEKSLQSKPSYEGYLNLGSSLAMQQKWSEAKAAFENATKQDPKKADPLWNLVLLHLQQKKNEQATAYVRRLRDLLPENDPRLEQLKKLNIRWR